MLFFCLEGAFGIQPRVKRSGTRGIGKKSNHDVKDYHSRAGTVVPAREWYFMGKFERSIRFGTRGVFAPGYVPNALSGLDSQSRSPVRTFKPKASSLM